MRAAEVFASAYRWVALLGAAVALAGLTGCLSATVEASFDPKAAEFILKQGTGTIEGQAFLRRDYGKLVTAAGERVFLLPATSYTLERFDKMFGGDYRAYFGTEIEDTPEEYYRYRRETKVDMRGKFTFENVAPGRYLVATRVYWRDPSKWFMLGGGIYDTVDVKEGETVQVIVSGK
jgi:hypothetical protein